MMLKGVLEETTGRGFQEKRNSMITVQFPESAKELMTTMGGAREGEISHPLSWAGERRENLFSR